MARLSRLAVAGQAHLVVLQAPAGQALVRDDDDRRRFLEALREASAVNRTALQAFALLDERALLLLTPEQAPALGATVQALGRRYVAGFNRRHGRRGALWDGRFRAAIVQPGAATLDAMVYVDTQPVREALAASAADYPWSSARHHLGLVREGGLSTSRAYWALGNTPFDRELAYRRRLEEGLPPSRVAQLAEASRKGWAVGDSGFLAELAQQAGRPVAPRPRGRPRRAQLV